MLLLFLDGTASTINDTYIFCSSTAPDVLDFYVDGSLVKRLTSA